MKDKETRFQIYMRMAAGACLDADAAAFEALDTSDISIRPKTERRIHHMICRESRRKTKQYGILKKAVAVCMVICTLLFGLSMSIQPVRAAFWNAVVTWYEKYISVVFVNETNEVSPLYIEEPALPEYLPTGWSIEVYEEDQASRIYQIHGTNGEQVIYEQTVAGGTDVWFDNTDCTVKEIRLKTGCEGYILLYPDDSVSLIWSDTYLYTLVGYNTAESILIEIANSIG